MMSKASERPRLVVNVQESSWDTAKEAASAACLISDAIKREHPELTLVATDMATIRATNRKLGLRFVWLTPPSAQDLLLRFDQGWSRPENLRIVVGRPAKVTAVKAGDKARQEVRQRRRVELETKAATGTTLTSKEKAALTKLRNIPDRPTTHGPKDTVTVKTGNGGTTVMGGRPLPGAKGKNPNLLAGRNRAFGARHAQPSALFSTAVDEAVEARVAVALAAAGLSPDAVGGDDDSPA
jgi:hypothetical protein